MLCVMLTPPTVVAMAYGRDLNNLSFAGVMGMWDPPRDKVYNTADQENFKISLPELRTP